MNDRDDPRSSEGRDDVRDARWALSPTSRKPVPELVGDRVVELVQSGRLEPGEKLPTEPDLARQMGVARSSVRTALQRLQVQGVVEVNRGRGWFVSTDPVRTSSDVLRERVAVRNVDLLEVMEVRIALEGTAVALAADRADRGQLDEIIKLSHAHREAPHDDPAVLVQTDEEFHGAIVEAAGNSFLSAVYDMITPLIADWRAQSYTGPAIHVRSATDHDQIAWQLRRRDDEGARIAMTGHLLGQQRAMVGALPPAEQDAARPLSLTMFLGNEKDRAAAEDTDR